MDATGPTKCPECGQTLPAGSPRALCPLCALRGAMDLGETSSRPIPKIFSNDGRAELGDYELLEEISRGGMGVVYRARQRSLDRIVAVKTLLSGRLASEDQLRRFKAEAVAAAGLHHPNIVAVHEVGTHQGTPFFAMDLVDGPSLGRILRNGPVAAHKAAGYLKTIAEAIHFAHNHGIIHRDLKPANILIDSTDQPRITDFGLAKNLAVDSSLTATGQIHGSPSYMPPEQASGDRTRIGVTSDVYALGAMLYHMLTGRPPFVAQTPAATLKLVETGEPLAPRLLIPGIPRDLNTVCLKCLEKDPGRRYATALELAEELGRFLRNEPIVARPISRFTRAWRWTCRNPALGGMAAAIVAASILGGWLVFHRHESAKLQEEFRLQQQQKQAVQEEFRLQLQRKLDDLDTGLIQVVNFSPTELAAAVGRRLAQNPKALRLKVGFYPETKTDYTITRLAGFLDELQTSMSREHATPVQMELYLYYKRAELEKAFLSGLIDLVRVGEGPLVRLRRKNPLVTPLVEQISGGKVSAIFVARSSPITNLAGLKGKTIAAGSPTATASGYKLLKTLLDGGLSPSDVTIDYQGASEGVPKLIVDGQYEVGVSRWERITGNESNRFRIIAQFSTTTMPWAARSGLDPGIQRSLTKVLCGLKDDRLLNYLTDVPTEGFKPATAETFDAMDRDMRDIEMRFFGPGGNPATRETIESP